MRLNPVTTQTIAFQRVPEPTEIRFCSERDPNAVIGVYLSGSVASQLYNMAQLQIHRNVRCYTNFETERGKYRVTLPHQEEDFLSFCYSLNPEQLRQLKNCTLIIQAEGVCPLNISFVFQTLYQQGVYPQAIELRDFALKPDENLERALEIATKIGSLKTLMLNVDSILTCYSDCINQLNAKINRIFQENKNNYRYDISDLNVLATIENNKSNNQLVRYHYVMEDGRTYDSCFLGETEAAVVPNPKMKVSAVDERAKKTPEVPYECYLEGTCEEQVSYLACFSSTSDVIPYTQFGKKNDEEFSLEYQNTEDLMRFAYAVLPEQKRSLYEKTLYLSLSGNVQKNPSPLEVLEILFQQRIFTRVLYLEQRYVTPDLLNHQLYKWIAKIPTLQKVVFHTGAKGDIPAQFKQDLINRLRQEEVEKNKVLQGPIPTPYSFIEKQYMTITLFDSRSETSYECSRIKWQKMDSIFYYYDWKLNS